jgi:hypothetical protein
VKPRWPRPIRWQLREAQAAFIAKAHTGNIAVTMQ